LNNNERKITNVAEMVIFNTMAKLIFLAQFISEMAYLAQYSNKTLSSFEINLNLNKNSKS